MLDLSTFGGIITDLPPDKLGNGAYSFNNLIPASAVNMKPRPGVSLNLAFNHQSYYGRYIIASAKPDDVDYSVILTCLNADQSTATNIIEAEFVCHPGIVVYQYILTQAHGQIVAGPQFPSASTIEFFSGAPALEFLPTGCQFGNKFFIYYPDLRPIVIMPAVDGTLKAYWCGIQSPTYYANVNPGGNDAANIVYDSSAGPSGNTLIFAYSFFSSRRNTYSQPSPLSYYVIPPSSPPSFGGTVSVSLGSVDILGDGSTTWLTDLIVGGTYVINNQEVVIDTITDDHNATMISAWGGANATGLIIYTTGPVKQIVISDFFNPRAIDNGYNSDIDYIVIGVRSSTNPGLMVIYPDSYLPVTFNTDGTFTQTALTGTVGVTNGSPTLDGSGGTAFLIELTIGGPVVVNGESMIVTAITDNDTATLQSNWTGSTISGLTAFTTPMFTFDIDPTFLAQGFDLNQLASALYVPPSVKFCERYGERIWIAGQRDSITFASTTYIDIDPAHLTGTVSLTNGSATLTGDRTLFADELEIDDTISINGVRLTVTDITNNSTATVSPVWPGVDVAGFAAYRLWRDLPKARLSLKIAGGAPSPETWTCADLYYSLYADGKYVGEIFDVIDGSQTAYLDRDTIHYNTASFELIGHNDRIWPGSYDNNTPGNIPNVFPECVQVNAEFLLTQALDQGDRITGLLATREVLFIAYQNAFNVLTVTNDGGGIPQPDIRPYQGRSGCIAPRSLCKTAAGEMAWIGTEGIFIDGSGEINQAYGGLTNLLEKLQCFSFFQGGQWVAKADLPGMTMKYSRDHHGLIIGNFTIDGDPNYWALLSFAPQFALCLFSGQAMTSNLLAYVDGNGEEMILTGDGQERIKQLLDDSVLTDLNPSDNGSAVYTCAWQGGLNRKPPPKDKKVAFRFTWNTARVDIPGLIAPSPDMFGITLTIIRCNLLQRDRNRLEASNTVTVPITPANLLIGRDIGIQPSEARYQSVGYSHDSNSGAYLSGVVEPMEVTQLVGFERDE